MWSGKKRFWYWVFRVGLVAVAIASLLILPWAFVFAAAFIGIAVFYWYAEVFAVGLTAAFLAGVTPWKVALALGGAVIVAEALKRWFEPRAWFSYIPIALASAVASFALFLAAL